MVSDNTNEKEMDQHQHTYNIEDIVLLYISFQAVLSGTLIY